MADQMKSMLQERRFDNLMGPKVPFMKDGILNLLQVADLTPEQRSQLIALGYGDLLQHDIGSLHSQGRTKQSIDFQLETVDQKRAATIIFSFASFTTSIHTHKLKLPKRIYIQMRFFTFPEVRTEAAYLTEQGPSQ